MLLLQLSYLGPLVVYSKRLKLFVFSIFWPWAYLMKVIQKRAVRIKTDISLFF